ncbi:MAG: serine protease, partial [Candidatus Competibacteraceae bacterium]|nr:serine protease [Candidatus Competibacteraceae bacterium]
MSHPLDGALVRFHGPKGRPAGAGVLVADGQILTCAHVVNAALGRVLDSQARPEPDRILNLDLPFLRSEKLQAVLTADGLWYPPQPQGDIQVRGEADVALLTLQVDLPPGAGPAAFAEVRGQRAAGHRLEAYGFPIPLGDWAYYRLEPNPLANGWLKIIAEQIHGTTVQPGFSGGPVWDADLSRVLGLAVVANEQDRTAFLIPTPLLRQLWPELPVQAVQHSAPATVSPGGESDETDEGYGPEPWIVKTLDHVDQAAPLRHLFEPSPRPSPAPGVAVVEGCFDDLPKYLADHVFLDPWPRPDDIPPEATSLAPLQFGQDTQAFWRALHQNLPASQQAQERDRQRQRVQVWLQQRERHLFCVSLNVQEQWRHLPNLIRAAQGFLAELSRDEPGLQLLLLFVCLPRYDRPPWWWPLWRWRLKWIRGVHWLDP